MTETVQNISQKLSNNPKDIQVYFIGVGGIGMSALARYFISKGATVYGYDKTATELTKTLEVSGINIHYEDNVLLIPKEVDFVVYTPAIPSNHTELNFYKDNGYPVLKRSDVLQIITETSFNICIAGTHGKTTTTSMVAHILRHAGYGCNAFLGGISANYQTNFWSDPNNVVVVEADEYDRSFLKLKPDVAIITSMDADHLDIYGTKEELQKTFVQFSEKLKPSGLLITKYGIGDNVQFTYPDKETYSYNNPSSDCFASNISIVNGSYIYDITINGETIKDIALSMGGMHNIENSVAAIAVAKHLKIDNEKIRDAVAAYRGVKRRFEYIIKNEEHVLIDDYAHHPEELRALITGVKDMYKGEKITLVFQPHLYSRTNDFAKEFADSLSLVDELILLPIYPARELPMPGVDSNMILDKVTAVNKSVLGKEELKQWMNNNKPKIVVMAGAGDIDTLVIPVKNILETK